MSLVPFQGSEMLTQMAMSRLMPKDEAATAQQMSLVGLIAGSTIETLSQCDVRTTESLGRKAEIISGLQIPDDVKAMAPDVLRHRVILTFEAEAEEMDADKVIARILEAVPTP